MDDLSNWYIRRSRKRFWAEDDEALSTLWYGLVQSLRAVAPMMPLIADHLWWNLRPGPRALGAPVRPGPRWPIPTRVLLAEIAELRAVVELGRQAAFDLGAQAAASRFARLIVAGAPHVAGASPARSCRRAADREARSSSARVEGELGAGSSRTCRSSAPSSAPGCARSAPRLPRAALPSSQAAASR